MITPTDSERAFIKTHQIRNTEELPQLGQKYLQNTVDTNKLKGEKERGA